MERQVASSLASAGVSTATVVIALRPHDRVDAATTAAAKSLGIPVESISRDQLVFVDGPLAPADVSVLVNTLLADPLQHECVVLDRAAPTVGTVVEVVRRAGVTDTEAAELLTASQRLGVPVRAATTGRRYEIFGELSATDLQTLVDRVLANAVIEDVAVGEVTATFASLDPVAVPVETFDLAALDVAALTLLNVARGMALDPAELVALRDIYRELGRPATDIELETFAQTWSEHCSHKTFRAGITTTTGERVEPLLAQLRSSTDAINAPWVVSAFVGNAGIVEFEPGHRLAIKVETHNHPSAVEPFGGANTGVGGVVRDVMAAPAHPVAVTDILCFGPLDTPLSALPVGVLPPSRIADGVTAGVADYGNKLGVPNVGGAVLYDPGYVANPLVFCGCVGRVHVGAAALRPPQSGDRVVVIGGAAGRDGIRGATFSSMTMDASTGSVAGASVQIGDPIVEKLLVDLLDELIDRENPLVRALTDCGAGGLSSAVGEMAEGIGADVELDLVPRKYPGLAPWEVWLSEAQERMVLAVDPTLMSEVTAAANRHGVLLADLGAFTGDARLVVRSSGVIVLDLPTDVLHDGRPRREMVADLISVTPAEADPDLRRRMVNEDPGAVLDRLLAHPNIASKQATIHRYDFEVQASTVVRPLTGAHLDGHSDGAVIVRPTETHGFAIGVGVNPWFGERDTRAMAYSVVDEAIRNVVVAGADPSRIALLDNFSWGDPRRASTLGELVGAVRGCVEAAALYGTPFVSGKDSLNNEYVGDDGVRHAIPPTLVITALGHVPDVDTTVTSDLKAAGNLLVLLGETLDELAGSHLDKVLGIDAGGAVPGRVDAAPERYRGFHEAVRAGLVKAAHDCSEGGIAVALAEMAIGGRLGIEVVVPGADVAVALFSESNGRIVAEVASGDVEAFTALLPGPVTVLGSVVAGPQVRIVAGPLRIERSIGELLTAWSGTDWGEPTD